MSGRISSLVKYSSAGERGGEDGEPVAWGGGMPALLVLVDGIPFVGGALPLLLLSEGVALEGLLAPDIVMMLVG